MPTVKAPLSTPPVAGSQPGAAAGEASAPSGSQGNRVVTQAGQNTSVATTSVSQPERQTAARSLSTPVTSSDQNAIESYSISIRSASQPENDFENSQFLPTPSGMPVEDLYDETNVGQAHDEANPELVYAEAADEPTYYQVPDNPAYVEPNLIGAYDEVTDESSHYEMPDEPNYEMDEGGMSVESEPIYSEAKLDHDYDTIPEHVYAEIDSPVTKMTARKYEGEQLRHLGSSVQAGESHRLVNYLINSIERGKISNANKESLMQLVEYNHKLNGQMSRIETLSAKIDSGKQLSPEEAMELKALFQANKHNMKIASGALTEMEETAHAQNRGLGIQEFAIVSSLKKHIANQHMALANKMAEYESVLPDNEPVSRSDRIDYALLQARAARNAANKMECFSNSNRKIKMVAALTKHIKALEHYANLEKGLPGSAKREGLAFEELDAWTTDFSLVKSKKSSKKLPPKEVAALKAQWDKSSSEFDQGRSSDWLPLTHPKISQANMMRLFIEHQMDADGVPKKQRPDMKFLMSRSLVETINKSEWPALSKPVTFNLGDQQYTYTSEITPAGRELEKRFELPYGTYSIKGVTCFDRLEHAHVPNLAQTKLVDEKGNVLVSALRHGILDPYDIDGKAIQKLPDRQLHDMLNDLVVEDPLDDDPELSEEDRQDLRTALVDDYAQKVRSDDVFATKIAEEMREQSSKLMAAELLSAAIANDPAKLQEALSTGKVEMNLGSVSLVTPDYLRHKLHEGKNERTMLTNQTNALKWLAENPPIQIVLRDDKGEGKIVDVTAKVRTFNFGVNKGGVNMQAPFHKLMGWDFAAKLNDPELEKLLGPADSPGLGGDAYQRAQEMGNSEDEAVRKKGTILTQVASQIKRIWADRSFKTSGNEPYKMVTRLSYALNLMGETPLFNCKSGKDRTGQLDSELKNMAATANITGQVPQPDARHTTESRNMRTAFALNSGNLDMQRQNTGLPGFKLGGVPALKDMMNADQWARYRGGSGYVKG